MKKYNILCILTLPCMKSSVFTAIRQKMWYHRKNEEHTKYMEKRAHEKEL